MIVRTFNARATPEAAPAYMRFFRETLVPSLARIAGHRGALVFDRPDGSEVAITVLTFWESMDAVRSFAGDRPERAVLEPEARAILSSYDELVLHFTVRVESLTAHRSAVGG